MLNAVAASCAGGRVTLNVTLLTPDRIYQSSDFRLTVGGLLSTDQSSKSVSLSYETFYGMLTYTGLGRWNSLSTAEYVVEWLEALGETSLAEMSEEIARQGSLWVKEVTASDGKDHPHTFVIAAFERGVAQAVVISNFQTVLDQRSRAHPELTVSSRHSLRDPVAIVTGCRPAVTRVQRRVLERAAARFADRPQRIRQAMIDLNATAASSPKARDTISERCSVISVDRDGTGFQTLTEPESVDAWFVAHGRATPDFRLLSRSLGIAEPRLVGASFATTAGSAAKPVPRLCAAPILGDADDRYSLEELGLPAHQTSRARDLNDEGVVLGAGTVIEAPSENWLWTWTENGGYVELNIAATNILTMALNASRTVAGALSEGVGTLRPFIWHEGPPTLLAVEGAEFDGGVRVLTDDGIAAGWVSLGPDRGQEHHRPAVWLPTGAIEILRDIPGDWGSVIDVDRHGLFLLWLHRGMVASAIALWSVDRGMIDVTADRYPGVIPVGIDDHERIVAVGHNGDGAAIALVGSAAGDFELLGTPAGWTPTATNGSGWIAGQILRPGNGQPWVRSPDGETNMLPLLADHSCCPFAINASGDVVGEGSADHGAHALLWSRLG